MTTSLLLALLCLSVGCGQGSSESFVTVQEYNQYVDTTNKNFAAHEGRLVTLEKYYKEEPATPPVPIVRFGTPPAGYVAPAITSAPTPAATTSPPTPPPVQQTVVTTPVAPAPAGTAAPPSTVASAQPQPAAPLQDPLQLLKDLHQRKLDELDGKVNRNTEDIAKINARLGTFATKDELKALETRVKALEPQPKPEAPPAKPAATRTETRTVGLATYRFTRH